MSELNFPNQTILNLVYPKKGKEEEEEEEKAEIPVERSAQKVLPRNRP
ncbi:hypothetical protein FOTG_15427 [Fusarium oxysporum f. sp. vasinfectum 25433]|jgi:hypothetical protein|uniref:Uncharacterized protein n=1 Tax=Fusarium oxysporum f. sp. vasinfectum 25433 TaxID=1089449 RepID=X0L5G9_FUSOX|nr:hypothetical protein FOTG_15427 [Fusarium oxysporum f. sp. vasinfectum 25433]